MIKIEMSARLAFRGVQFPALVLIMLLAVAPSGLAAQEVAGAAAQMQVRTAAETATALLPDAPMQSVVPTAPSPALQIVILQGEDALNNIKDRTAREPIIQVQDENHNPVAGASVVFTIQSGGGHAGASFLHGSTTFSGQTDSTGRIVARGFHPNGSTGQFHIAVSASKGQLLTHSVIVQQNVVAATAATASTGGFVGVIATHVVLVSAVAAGAVAGAVVTGVVLTRSTPTTVTAGTGSVGAPQAKISIHFNFPK